MALQNKLSHPKRYITTHNADGKAIVDESLSSDAPFYSLADGDAAFAHCFVTKTFPVELSDGADMAVYSDFLAKPPGLVVSSGTVLRYVDMPPGATSPMHQTASLDYGVVLEGEIDLVLDSGDTRPMKRGDICVQRATMHAWKNRSQTEWARMLYVLQPTAPLTVNGQAVQERLGDMQGVDASS